MSDIKNSKPGTATLLKFANRLKQRLGDDHKDQEDGFIAPESIAEADKLILTLCLDCSTELGRNLASLTELWDKMKAIGETPERADISYRFFLQAHEIKDIGAICGYDLIAHFAESLRDYIGKTELNMQAQVVIIQAHLDAMNIVHQQGVKKNAGPQAEELKKMVARAIEKYH